MNVVFTWMVFRARKIVRKGYSKSTPLLEQNVPLLKRLSSLGPKHNRLNFEYRETHLILRYGRLGSVYPSKSTV